MPITLDPPWLPEIPGDPAGMRALASTLRGHAGSVGGLAAGMRGDMSGMTFEGPAATDFRTRLGTVVDAYRDAQTQLQDLAGRLETAATDVEQQQRAREVRLEQMWAEYRDAMRQLAPGAAQ